MTHRAWFLGLFAAIGLSLLACPNSTEGSSAPERSASPRPNLVIILADDLGWMDLGCQGSTFFETPHLDALAAQGMQFTQAYTAAPVCSPTRASILTGQYPARLNLTDWLPGRPDRPSQKLLRPEILQHLPREERTLAEALRDAGYVSASIGKWHLGGEGFLPEDQGFDRNIAGTQAGSPPGGYFAFQTPTLQLEPGEYLTDRLAQEAVTFIQDHHDQPFFLYLTHYTVHIPLQAKEDAIAKYREKAEAHPDDPQNNPIYAAMIQSLDDSAGRVMQALEEVGVADRTIVLFTSDNGGLSVSEGPHTPATSNAPLREGKGFLYEGGIRVPWIVRWPDVIEAGTVCDVPVSTIDIVPTVLEAVGLDPDAGSRIDGESLMPLWTQSGPLQRDTLFWHYPHYSNQGGKPGGIIRQGDHKLIEFYEDGRVELYDLAQDVGEQNNLTGAMPEVARRLRSELDDWRRSVHARMPTPNPDYDPEPSEGPP